MVLGSVRGTHGIGGEGVGGQPARASRNCRSGKKTENVRLLKVYNVEHCVLEVVAEEVVLF